MKASPVSRKGQIALETMILIGFLLMLTIPLIYMLYTRVTGVQEQLRVLEAVRAADAISSAIATVGVLGPNGTATVDVVFPDGMTSFTVGTTHPREIVLSVDTSLGVIEIVKSLPYNVSEGAPIPRRTGKQTVYVISYENRDIRLTSAKPTG